jgi:hypothetical protein
MVHKFTIFGERCSGTNFLKYSILQNFHIEFTEKYGHKHFFGYYSFQNNKEEDNTLFIGIVRDPIEWIDSFYKKLHHIPPENRVDINTFLFNPFYSIDSLENNVEIMKDRHITSGDRYKNIFELRDVKTHFLVNEMPKKVKHYLFIRYEDLRDHYEKVLNFFHIKFKLIRKNRIYTKILKYKGTHDKIYYRKKVVLEQSIIDKIKEHLDTEFENSLGYLL